MDYKLINPLNFSIMKAFKSTIAFVAVFLLVSLFRVNAQSYQYEWTNSFNGVEGEDPGYCLGHLIKGFYTYHLTIHVDKQTGFIDFVHNNVVRYDLIDVVTGEKLILIDTAHDTYNTNGNFYFWNWITGANLPIGDWPVEGTLVWASFKWISRGGMKVTMREVLQLHMDANGVMRVEKDKPYADCN